MRTAISDIEQHVVRDSCNLPCGKIFTLLSDDGNQEETKEGHLVDIESRLPSDRRIVAAVPQNNNESLRDNIDGEIDMDTMFKSLQVAILAQIQNERRSLKNAKHRHAPVQSVNHDDIELQEGVVETIIRPDSTSILNSPLHSLGGGNSEYFLTLNVLVYLSAEDLCVLSQSSRYFAAICRSAHLWSAAYERDFATDAHLSSSMFSRINYLERYRDHLRLVDRSKQEKLQLARDIRRLKQMDIVERVLDFLQMRTLGPVCMLCIFLSIVLFCQWEDGLHIPLWATGVPIAFSIIYAMMALGVIHWVHKHEYTMDHMLRGFWSNMTGPLVYFYQEAMNENSQLFYVVQAMLGMMVIQIGLVIIKLTSMVPVSFQTQFSWGIVFIPLWLLFFMFLVSPCTRFRINPATYIFIFFIFWVPMFILFACLTQKLDNHRWMRMALIMIPFYVIESIVLLAALAFLVCGIIK
jgi:hypothetical protein